MMTSTATRAAFVMAAWSVCVAADLKNMTATPGDDVTLQCRAPSDDDIIGIEWTRSDLISDDYVFFLRGNHQPEHYQHESYRGRVQLRDGELTAGDASLILRNVSVDDSGTYECLVRTSRLGLTDSAVTIDLRVTDSRLGVLMLYVSTPVVLVFVGVVVFIALKNLYKSNNKTKTTSDAEPKTESETESKTKGDPQTTTETTAQL